MTEQKLREMIEQIKELGTLELYVLSQEVIKEIDRKIKNG